MVDRHGQLRRVDRHDDRGVQGRDDGLGHRRRSGHRLERRRRVGQRDRDGRREHHAADGHRGAAAIRGVGRNGRQRHRLHVGAADERVWRKRRLDFGSLQGRRRPQRGRYGASNRLAGEHGVRRHRDGRGGERRSGERDNQSGSPDELRRLGRQRRRLHMGDRHQRIGRQGDADGVPASCTRRAPSVG